MQPGTAAGGLQALSAGAGLRYGLLGLPLAFVALPLYVVLPHHYAREFGMPLDTLGAVLLGARLFDALVDPWIGRWCDRLFAHSLQRLLATSALAALALCAGFALLFFPPLRDPRWLPAGTALLLAFTYAAYSLLSVAHQSWGAMLGGDERMRSRITGWREGLGLMGVVLASVLPAWAGLESLVVLFWLLLGLGWLAWTRAPRPTPALRHAKAGSPVWWPWHDRWFLRLLAVFLINGIASAVPATLVLFYVQDRLQGSQAVASAALGLYFVCAALSLPIWMRLVARHGLVRSWLHGMVLSVAAFAGAALLGPGDAAAFLLICAVSGLALGTDLALPGALLAGVIARAHARGRAEGAYFGWWNLVAKLNLALAAGLALPILDAFGYRPGATDPAGLRALAFAYGALPCLLKLAAAGALILLLRPLATRPSAST